LPQSGQYLSPAPTSASEGDTFSLAGSFSEGGAAACFPCPAGSHPIALFWAGDMGSESGTVNDTLYPSLFFGGTGFNVGGTATLPQIRRQGLRCF
jgi:hypothetical protein